MTNQSATPSDSGFANSDAAPPAAGNPWRRDDIDDTWDTSIPQANQRSTSAENSSVPGILRPGDATHASEADDTLNAWSPISRPPQYAAQAPEPGTPDRVPSILRPGSGHIGQETNPFRRKDNAAPESLPPTDAFSKLDMNDANVNPWGSNDAQQQQQQPLSTAQNGAPIVVLQPEDNDPWASSKGPSPKPPGSPALMSVPSEDGSGWDSEPPAIKISPPDRPGKTMLSPELTEDQNVWDELDRTAQDKGKGVAEKEDDWNLIDTDSEDEDSSKPKLGEASAALAETVPPAVPPRDETRQKWVPPRQPVDGKTETYQIKNIQWMDLSAGREMRTSPILVQNANGPCPLVALVNALTLTTPADIPTTALVETLKSREQVSLNLLLDAVFDELMSPRRTSHDEALPDVDELYSFLQSLHTGMNVNPRFIPDERVLEAFQRSTLTDVNVEDRGEVIPGTFENTAEMGLYAAFSIPLIHGWVPAKSDAVYDALKRQAVSYEDAQNLLFREEELESKLTGPTGGLSHEEQQLYQDILTIKSFLNISATQLTAWGIEVISKVMKPGSFAIFFRNDHFSTLYCHPETKSLYALVTDAGYRTESKVVWESLVDVNGEHSAYLSGDFKPVRPEDANTQADPDLWATAASAGPSTESQAAAAAPTSPGVDQEQEDRDLALALQLQEEEDQRQRDDEARRRRESQLSEQYIEQDGRQTQPSRSPLVGDRRSSASNWRSPAQPPRNRVSSSGAAATTPSSMIPPSSPSPATRRPSAASSSTPAASSQPPIQPMTAPPPPTYEEASNDPSYEPPVGHPAHATSSRNSATAASVSGRQSVAGYGGRMGRRVQGQSAQGMQRERERDCVVM